MLIVDRDLSWRPPPSPRDCFNLTLEMLIVDRPIQQKIDARICHSFNLTLEMLIVDRIISIFRSILFLTFQSHT